MSPGCGFAEEEEGEEEVDDVAGDEEEDDVVLAFEGGRGAFELCARTRSQVCVVDKRKTEGVERLSMLGCSAPLNNRCKDSDMVGSGVQRKTDAKGDVCVS
jgi:hypothetical protein